MKVKCESQRLWQHITQVATIEQTNLMQNKFFEALAKYPKSDDIERVNQDRLQEN
jgi:hypothetical protein